MTPPFDLFADYGWWIAGLVLLVLEVAIPGVYLIFFAVAALVVGTNVAILGSGGWFGIGQQIVAFVVLSVLAILAGRRIYGENGIRPKNGRAPSRTDRLIGRRTVLTEPIEEGRGRVAIEDGWWSVEGPDLPRGTKVRITGAKGSILTVEPADPKAG